MVSIPGERPIVRRRYGRHFFIFVAFHVLIILGIWQGDYSETLMNGTTL
jgi:hypothetical protein